MEKLSEFLVEKRTEFKLSLRSAASLIGISHSYLNFIEKGVDPRRNEAYKPTPEALMLISNAYKVPYEKLLILAGYMPSPDDIKLQLREDHEIDIENEIHWLREELTSGLYTLSGQAINEEAMGCLIDAMYFGLRLAKIINKASKSSEDIK